MGIVATSPEGYTIVKLGYQKYAMVGQKKKCVEIRKTPYDVIDHAMHYVECENVVGSDEEAKELMELVNKNVK
jgi:hypothetical protein